MGVVIRLSGRMVDDRGAATVWVLMGGLVILGVALAVTTAGAAMVARHRAEAAADLAALAGATRAVEDEEAACQRAAEISSANGARLTNCHLHGFDVTVVVEVVPVGPAALAGTARGSARAGPVAPLRTVSAALSTIARAEAGWIGVAWRGG